MNNSPHYVWKYDNNTVALDAVESKNVTPDDDRTFFIFELSREVAFDHRESLHITANYNNVEKEKYGEIVTNILNIQNDICDFRLYGVALNRTDFIDIAKIIEQNYLKIDRNYVQEQKFDVEIIFNGVCKYISNSEIPVSKIKSIDYYHIPVEEFNEFLINNDMYEHLDLTKTKKAFRDEGYTKCNEGRTDNTISIESKEKLGKRVKVISFYADKVNSAIYELKDDKVEG